MLIRSLSIPLVLCVAALGCRGQIDGRYPAHGDAIAATTPVYLSDLTPDRQVDGWGPMERDMSNGETEAGDGTHLSIAGKQYSKGLGVHAYSEVRYVVPDDCSTFTAEVGVDDEVAGYEAAITFEVRVDDATVASSPLMHNKVGAYRLETPVRGGSVVTLIVRDLEGPPDNAHGDWADAHFGCGGTGGEEGTGGSGPPPGSFDVTTVGAIPDDGADDTHAIRQALNHVSAGESLYFPPGVYLLGANQELPLKQGVAWYGVPGRSVLQGGGQGSGLTSWDGMAQSIHVEGFVFDNTCLFFHWRSRDVVVTRSWFRQAGGFCANAAVVFAEGGENLEVSSNRFENGRLGVVSWGPLRYARVLGNHADGMVQFISFGETPGFYSDSIDVSRNTLLHMSRMGVEIQTHGPNLVVEDNYVSSFINLGLPEVPGCFSYGGYSCDTMALSIAMGPGPAAANARINRNRLYGAPGVSWGIELSVGPGSVVEDNFIYDHTIAIVGNHADPSVNQDVRRNVICGGWDYAGGRAYNAWWSTLAGQGNHWYESCSSAPAITAPPPPPF